MCYVERIFNLPPFISPVHQSNVMSLCLRHLSCLFFQKCEICGYQLKNGRSEYLHHHRYIKHGIPLPPGRTPHSCDICQKVFFTKFQLKEHKMSHEKEEPQFTCSHCGQVRNLLLPCRCRALSSQTE